MEEGKQQVVEEVKQPKVWLTVLVTVIVTAVVVSGLVGVITYFSFNQKMVGYQLDINVLEEQLDRYEAEESDELDMDGKIILDKEAFPRVTYMGNLYGEFEGYTDDEKLKLQEEVVNKFVEVMERDGYTVVEVEIGVPNDHGITALNSVLYNENATEGMRQLQDYNRAFRQNEDGGYELMLDTPPGYLG